MLWHAHNTCLSILESIHNLPLLNIGGVKFEGSAQNDLGAAVACGNDLVLTHVACGELLAGSAVASPFTRAMMEGTIVIMAWMEERDIIFVVSDDGVGIPPEKLPHILMGESQGGGSNIGIYNTHLRLRLIYGEKYGLHYGSVYGEGTEVTIRIPAKNAPE